MSPARHSPAKRSWDSHNVLLALSSPKASWLPYFGCLSCQVQGCWLHCIHRFCSGAWLLDICFDLFRSGLGRMKSASTKAFTISEEERLKAYFLSTSFSSVEAEKGWICVENLTFSPSFPRTPELYRIFSHTHLSSLFHFSFPSYSSIVSVGCLVFKSWLSYQGSEKQTCQYHSV